MFSGIGDSIGKAVGAQTDKVGQLLDDRPVLIGIVLIALAVISCLVCYYFMGGFSSMTAVMTTVMGGAAGGFGFYLLFTALEKKHEGKAWFENLKKVTNLILSILGPLALLGVCGMIMTLGPTNGLFYMALVVSPAALALFTDVTLPTLCEPDLEFVTSRPNHQNKASVPPPLASKKQTPSAT